VGPDFIDVRFFEASKDVDPKTQKIINEKLESMARLYNQKIKGLMQSNGDYFKQITMF